MPAHWESLASLGPRPMEHTPSQINLAFWRTTDTVSRLPMPPPDMPSSLGPGLGDRLTGQWWQLPSGKVHLMCTLNPTLSLCRKL